jgi:OFA family oxalate/formate antiporter-like MFS transporter
MSRYWQTAFSVGPAEVGQIFFFILVPTGIFMFLVGRLLEQWKPGWFMGIGVLICAGTTVLLPLSWSFSGVYVWAFIMSGSTAMIYITGLTVVQNWFPDRRGLVSGLFNMSFGVSAALLSPVYNFILDAFAYHWVTTGAALCTLIFGLIPAGLIRFPLPSEIPTSGGQSPIMPNSRPSSMTMFESLKTRSFWGLWFTWAFAGAAGISMVILSTAFGKTRGLSSHEAVLLLTAFNLTNGTSRVISGYLSDYIGRKRTLTLSFAMAGAAYFCITQTGSLTIWLALFAAIGYAFGTLFSVSAPLVGDCFGMDHFGSIIGLIFTAYGFVAGIIGPWFTGRLLDITGGNFTVIFSYLGVLMLSAAVLIQITKPETECILPVR